MKTPQIDELIKTAHRNGRWAAPIAGWGRDKGLLETLVEKDLSLLRRGMSAAALYAKCIDGADDADRASWQEYVDDLVAAAARPPLPMES